MCTRFSTAALVALAVAMLFVAPSQSAGKSRRAKPATIITEAIVPEVKRVMITYDVERQVVLFTGYERSFDVAKNPSPSEAEIPFSMGVYMFYLKAMTALDVERGAERPLDPMEIAALRPFLSTSEQGLIRELGGAPKCFSIWEGKLVSATNASGNAVSLTQKTFDEDVRTATEKVEEYCVRVIKRWMAARHAPPSQRLVPRKHRHQPPRQLSVPADDDDLLTARAAIIAPRDFSGVLFFSATRTGIA